MMKKMYGSDTTTSWNFDDDEDDKTLLLDGKERLKYFTGEFPAVQQPLRSKGARLLQSIRKLLHLD